MIKSLNIGYKFKKVYVVDKEVKFRCLRKETSKLPKNSNKRYKAK